MWYTVFNQSLTHIIDLKFQLNGIWLEFGKNDELLAEWMHIQFNWIQCRDHFYKCQTIYNKYILYSWIGNWFSFMSLSSFVFRVFFSSFILKFHAILVLWTFVFNIHIVAYWHEWQKVEFVFFSSALLLASNDFKNSIFRNDSKWMKI